MSNEIPIGKYLFKLITIAHAARRPVLLEGETGIGKSEFVRSVCDALGMGFVSLDLSLLEPPDLVGLPTMASGRTVYAPPNVLPTEGSGILLLEELNRAESYIRQPALQLLTARRLHEYVLPAGWSCVAAINPDDGDYEVATLDPALLARFLTLRVCAGRREWLAWAQSADVHPAVITVVRSHDEVFGEVPPRSWTYASDMLRALGPEDRGQHGLINDLIEPYIGPVWADLLLSVLDRYSGELEIQPLELLAHYDEDLSLGIAIRGYRDGGKTDVLSEIVHRLAAVLRGPESAALAQKGELRLDSFDAFIADLPGDSRELLQEAISQNAAVALELGFSVDDVAASSPGSALARNLERWATTPLLRHRAHMAASLIAARQRRTSQSPIVWTPRSRAVLAPLLALQGPAIDRLRLSLEGPVRGMAR